MSNLPDPRILDERLVDRNRLAGKLSEKDYESYLKSLPDEAGNATYIEISPDDEESNEDSES